MRCLSTLVMALTMIVVSQPVYSADILTVQNDIQLRVYGTIPPATEWTLEFSRTGNQFGHTIMAIQIGEMIKIINSDDFTISGRPYTLTANSGPASQQIIIKTMPSSTAGHFRNIKISTR